MLASGDLVLDPDRHEVTIRGAALDLPLKEFEVLQLLLERAGRVVTRDQLIDEVWGHDYVGDTKTLDVHIKRLRSRIEADPVDPRADPHGAGCRATRSWSPSAPIRR